MAVGGGGKKEVGADGDIVIEDLREISNWKGGREEGVS